MYEIVIIEFIFYIIDYSIREKKVQSLKGFTASPWVMACCSRQAMRKGFET